MSKVRYKIEKYDSDYTFNTIMKGQLSEGDYENLATEAAEDFYYHHDGWECEWPMEIEIIVEGKSYGVIEVELDNCPTFTVA